MGTNYYRIPSESEVIERLERLKQEVDYMIERPEKVTLHHEEDAWSEFTDKFRIHLGKRSKGWKFCWNFNDNKFYSNKKELEDFVRKGRVVDEYGEIMNPDEFLKMAFDWDKKGSLIFDEKYAYENNYFTWMKDPSQYYDNIIDGLRVSNTTNFS